MYLKNVFFITNRYGIQQSNKRPAIFVCTGLNPPGVKLNLHLSFPESSYICNNAVSGYIYTYVIIYTLRVDVNITSGDESVNKKDFKKWDALMTTTECKQQVGIHNMECFERVAVA